ncbi:VOC family protein [Levilactobacillus fuyuanensis]|uniref:Glyoxalase/bleomycin resistance/extradiol dioxygenase family protein n=1 Tax=Levilactobacillus fuyuanensis TaxID=2486022 RepID=A0ABW4H4S4_9LACO|nr:glyoxalase/bleomycin resistance/extradiol dioxygenase family protein [Levilactobacillus fuyuanensis]
MQSRLIPSISFESAKDALAYYQEVFGAADVYRFSPDAAQAKQFGLPADANLDDITIHAGFSILGMNFQCADAFRGKPEPTNQIDMILDINADDAASAQAAEDFYQRVVASGTVTVDMPFESQFWGGKMGHFTDKYGISWMLHVMPWSQIKDPNIQ